jgi:hypothetical protein
MIFYLTQRIYISIPKVMEREGEYHRMDNAD